MKIKKISALLIAFILFGCISINAKATESPKVAAAMSSEDSATIQNTIDQFFTLYYDGMRTKTAPDLSPITVENANTFLYSAMMDYEVRSAKFFGTGFESYSYSYTIKDTVSEGNHVTVNLDVFTEIRFEDQNDISKRHNVYSFDLEKIGDDWRISNIDSDHIVFTAFIDALPPMTLASDTDDFSTQVYGLIDSYMGDLEELVQSEADLYRSGDPASSYNPDNAILPCAANSFVSYDWHDAVSYADQFALNHNDLFYDAKNSEGEDEDCTNFVSQCVWAGLGGWDFDASTSVNKTNIANHYRMYYEGKSGWYANDWFGHGSGGSGPWENVTNHYNFVTGSPAKGPSGTGANDGKLYTQLRAAYINPGDTVQLRSSSSNKYKHSIFVVSTEYESPNPIEYRQILCDAHNSDYYHEPLTTFISSFGGTKCYLRAISYDGANF